MPAKVETYLQVLPEEFLRRNPYQKWRCDIFSGDGSDHHGVGDTEAKALLNASLAYMRWVEPTKYPPHSAEQYNG